MKAVKSVFGIRSSPGLDEAADTVVGDRTDSFSPMRQNMAALRARLSSTQVRPRGMRLRVDARPLPRTRANTRL
jgi:hypothetical protein